MQLPECRKEYVLSVTRCSKVTIRIKNKTGSASGSITPTRFCGEEVGLVQLW